MSLLIRLEVRKEEGRLSIATRLALAKEPEGDRKRDRKERKLGIIQLELKRDNFIRHVGTAPYRRVLPLSQHQQQSQTAI